jgi:hypothetical protein
MNKLLVILVLLLLVGGGLCGLLLMKKYMTATAKIGSLNRDVRRSNENVERLSELVAARCPTKMLFLHHSVGRRILYAGGLQRMLFDRGIFVSGATYGDVIGQKTDIPDWEPKFRDRMEEILTFKSHPDRYHDDGTRNEIVMFKSCYPNSNIVEPGKEGESARAWEMETFKGVFERLKPEMLGQPETLFIYLTAPPLVDARTTPENAARARQFNDWLIDEFLPEYQAASETDNLVIFDLFGFLAGPDHLLNREYRREQETDSHPTDEASRLAAEAFIEFFEPIWLEWQQRREARAG